MPRTTRSMKPTDRARSALLSSDDDVWEDIPETPKKDESRPASPSPTGSIRSSPRKRKLPHRTAYIATPPRKPSSTPQITKPPRAPRNIVATEEIVDGALQGASFTVRYLFDVFSTAIHLLRRPLYLLAFLWLLALIIGRISHTLRVAFAPLCFVPGFSSSALCRPASPQGRGRGLPQWADYPKLVDVQSTTFEHLLDESVGGSGLSLDIKKAEMATSDLVTLVRVSDLNARDMLGDTLVEFVDDAKKTGRGLQKLSSKIGGAVDSIMAVNDYALHAIEAAHSKSPSRYSLNSLVPWSRSTSRPTNEVVTETFTEAMNVLSSTMQRLILEAEVNLANLDKLEERLSTLHELVSREDSSLSSAKSELLSELWTKLGGNRKLLRGFEGHLSLLRNLGSYRKKALVHVAAALQTLQAMSDDMEDMRERVAAPDIVGSKIPVEVHMKSIRSGLERLREGRVKAKSLEEEAVRRVLSIGPDSE